MKKMHPAFSLIEVIFVLVILGIVASISSQIIVQVYENYVTQKALYNVNTKTELASTQIVNRLSHVIDETTIVKDPNYTTYTKADESVSWVRMKDIPADDNNFTIVEWIGYDNDSFAAGATPYWTGLSDYESATRQSFQTPGSQLTQAQTIIQNLSEGKVNLTSSYPAAVIFQQQNNLYRTGAEYDPACMGLIETNQTACIFRVSLNSDDNLSFEDNKTKIVTERYKLSWSAYALVPEENEPNDYNLSLYYNYQPWNQESYKDGQKELLIPHISVFKFTENGGVIQLKLCATQQIGEDFNISSCKEKAIIR